MTDNSICPIALCEGPRDASFYTYRLNFGVSCTMACYVWYVENSQPRTLVDAGATAAIFREKGMPERDLNSVEDGLARLGLKPEDIEVVIVTHLHFDHIALGYLFKKARFIVQKRELDYARNPHPIDAHIFDRNTFEGLALEVIDGQKEILPGVSVFLTPGHTPGGQSVEVNTAAGKAIITGFCGTLATFEPTEAMRHKGWEVTTPLIHHDVRNAYDSVLAVKRRADIILPLHEPTFINRESIP